jgi:hypothetical protein
MLRAALFFLLALAPAAAQTPALDGSGNNVANPSWNAALSPFLPTAGPSLPTAYGDGVSSLANPLGPNPRLVSNALLARAPFFDNAVSVAMFSAAWGQFIAHDLILTSGSADGADVVNVTVPACDANLDRGCSGRSNMTLKRTQWLAASGTSAANPRVQLNAQTGWLDASAVYGASAADAQRVRAFVGGMLLVDPLIGLPSTAIRGGGTAACAAVGMANAPGFDPCTLRIAGDVRANVAPGIFAVQGLFVLEHNWWAATLAKRNPSWSDETLFQEARKRIIAEIQVITCV